jgi:lysozyme family protein
VKENRFSIEYVLNDEGGFAERASEPGGAVNKGISMLVFREWRRSKGKPDPTLDDLRNLTDEEATEIYSVIADRVRFDNLPDGLDYIMLNTAVMQGVRGSIRLLQEALRLPMTGYWDGDTLAAATSADLATALKVLLLQMRGKMRSPGVAKYGGGWSDRIVRVAQRAEDMAEREERPAS